MKNNKFLRILCAALLLAVMLSSFTACRKKDPEQTEETTDATDETGIGGVDVGEFKDVLDANGNKIGEEIYFADGTLKYVEHYNQQGEVISSTLYNKDGTVSVEEGRNYDSTGKITRYVTVKYEYENGVLKQYNESYFNENKWCTSTYGYNADGSSQGFYTYEYDNAGNEIVKKEYGENMALRFVFETEYNDKNQPVKEITKNDKEVVTGITVNEYNEKGLISKKSECAPDGTVRNYCDYIYDKDGKLVEEQIFVSDGQGGFVRYN